MGFNRHQHYPYIGDAVPDALHYKDMLQFKEFGFNIMRTAHYPQDNAILDACDKLGILVYEEAPSWISMSTDKEWWNNFEQSERVMIRNHRNHPSVIIWGGGINHRGYVPLAHNTAKQEDPTRLTASQGSRWTGWQTSGLTDINANMLYGPFIWDRSEPMFAMEGRVGPEALAPFRKDSLMTGLISWTAHAYYTFHPTHDKAKNKIDRTRSGGMTIFRNPKPELHWYKAELRKEPFVYLLEAWKKGQDSITVFSNAQSVELSINGKIIETKFPSKDTIYDGLHHAPFLFKNLKYADGEVKAKAIFKDGKTKEVVHKTAGQPYAIELMLDTVGRKFIVTIITDTDVLHTAHHFNHVAHTKRLIETVHTRQCLLRILGRIKMLGWIEADIAVATLLLAIFAKIVQQNLTTTRLRFGKGTHRVQLVHLNLFLWAFFLLIQHTT